MLGYPFKISSEKDMRDSLYSGKKEKGYNSSHEFVFLVVSARKINLFCGIRLLPFLKKFDRLEFRSHYARALYD